ncbi:hypothetical protein [Bordetella hinzii]|uniref:Uncharacterized protein n=3 Tax=Bordetella hinzii TaxID=103855 RepID=A0AAN1RUC1_9BORD|nr:hypothetical protein [Bordetella hinzii]AKQ54816.1 hypothetical protein ACR54_01491 [Bordetella hinzii]AKQ59329.1 hypothetical protein ACR55_01452 [Bordetella hinzii]AZW15427.1 hypothetical protein CS347_00755 [Bordetella hinzii]KCB24375.1 hypothetical protein L543_2606 [Bordetella hinzii L60]KCB25408.1 hypothetical protein L544_0721 [Bordetella hinzii OH87 BAL007II]
MQPSRRAFLTGRRPPRSPWDTFCERVSAAAVGELKQGDRPRLVLGHPQDAWRARELAEAHGITLALWEGPGGAAQPACLWLDPGALKAWRVEGDAIVAEPGCPVGLLAAQGCAQFAQADPAQTVAAWLAGATGYIEPADSGLLAATVMFSDGTVEPLGAFGAADTQPLRSATVQSLVPALFQLAGSADAQACAGPQGWTARFRLDAMREPANLAQVLLGHGGALGWVQDSRWTRGQPAAEPRQRSREGWRLDMRVKALFDPHGRFPEIREPGAQE